ncbi:MAG: rRNA pseudouridine synthase [Clostridia bacterium]|nr:rRNA pseudouridine synthase [Clostridia bacterium]
MERLDKVIASQGQYSRKEVKSLIARRRVTVDGVTAKAPEQKVDADQSTICIDGAPLTVKRQLYLLLNKPRGYVSSTDDSDGVSVLELVPRELFRQGLFPAGRLDKDTTGMMVITDDGQMAHRILAPKKHVKKRYLVTIDIPPTETMRTRFAEGINLVEGLTKPAALEIAGEYQALVTLTEGRYHQIKRMFSACGATVTALHRVSMGNLNLPDDLKEGEVRELTPEELLKLEEIE